MNKYTIHFFLLFFLLLSVNINTAWASDIAPAPCTYNVINGWTQTINIQCSQDINFNGASIQFTVDNPSGLSNLNSVWGFINLPRYPMNPYLKLNGNTVTLDLTFEIDPVILKANTPTYISYSTNNNVNVTSFALYPPGSAKSSGTLTFSKSTSSDPLPDDVTIHIAGISNPFSTDIHFPAQTTLTNIPFGAYQLSAKGSVNGQPVVIGVTPNQVALDDTHTSVPVTLSYTSTAASLTIYLPTSKPSDVTSNTIMAHVLDPNNMDHPISVPWNSSATLNGLVAGLTYKLSADAMNGQQYRYQFTFYPSSIVAQKGQNAATIGVTSSPIPTGKVDVNIIGLPPNQPTSLFFTNLVNQNTLTFNNVLNGFHEYVLPVGNYNLSAQVIFANGNRYGVNPITLTVQPNATTTANLQFIATPVKGVNGWPNYIAMGAVTDDSTSVTNSLKTRPVDAIFKYAGFGGNGDPGQIIYPIFTMQTADQAKTLTTYYQQNNTFRLVKPVMVVYTAQMSGGVSYTDFEFNNLVMHYINLIMESQKIQSYKTTDNPFPGSIVLNPDLLGMVQQQNLIPALNSAISKVSLQKALQTAVCFATHTITTPYGQNLNYDQLFQAIRSQTTDNWSAMSIWDQYKMRYFNDCMANPTVPPSIIIPNFTNDFPGWVESTNWLIRQLAPNVTFGWQENLWATGTANWVHANYDSVTLKTKFADPTVATINAAHAYSGTYRPDFIVFDKYEMDTIPSAVSVGYLYNARDWSNVLSYAKNISESLGSVPVMLWQIPGSHLQVNNDIDTRTGRASTEPDYFFADATNPLPNLKSYISTITLPTAIYGYSNIVTYLSMDELGNVGNYTWQTQHLQKAADAHVFSILWGGGNTTSVSSYPSDDNGWLANRIINYYKNPTPISFALKQKAIHRTLKKHLKAKAM